jgi:hypothetical protein
MDSGLKKSGRDARPWPVFTNAGPSEVSTLRRAWTWGR